MIIGEEKEKLLGYHEASATYAILSFKYEQERV